MAKKQAFQDGDDYMSYIYKDTNPNPAINQDDPIVEPIVDPVDDFDDQLDDPIVEPVVDPVVEPVVEPADDPIDPVEEPTEQVVDPDNPLGLEVDENGNFLDWDDTPDDAVVTDPVDPSLGPITEVAFNEIATGLGLTIEEGKKIDKETLIASVKEQIRKAEEKDFLEGVPTELREAVDIAKQGGDYVGYLSEKEVDYNDFSADEFVAMGIQRYFKNEDGTINDVKLQEYIDKLDPVTKQMEADRVKAALEAKQAARLNTIKERAQTRKNEEAKKAREAITKIDNIASLKLQDKHKEQILRIIETGQLNKVVFGENKGELDYAQVAEVVFNKLYGDKIISVNSQRVRNSTKRDVLDTLSNKNVKGTPNSRVNPTIVKANPMDSYMKQLMGG